MSCESTSSVITDLWKQYGELAKKVGCTAAGIATSNPAIVVECVEKLNKAEEVLKNMISYWNKMAGNSWAKLGHRSLTVGSSETGTIVGPGDRTFMTPVPLSYDTVKLTLEETDGKGETYVEVCLNNGSGKCTKVKSTTFNEDKAGKSGHGKIEVNIDNAKGKYLVVLLNGKSVTNKFEYKISLAKVVTATATKA